MAIVTTQNTVINANDDPGLNPYYNRDNRTIVDSATGSVLFVTDRAIEVNYYEQLIQQNYITSISETNNPGGAFDGELQFKLGDNFGADANLIYDDVTRVFRAPAVSTDRLLYSNGQPWSFAGGGIAYGNADVAAFLSNNVITIQDVTTNVATANTVVASTFRYPNGQPAFVSYSDIDVARLLDTGSNAGVRIIDVNANGNVIAGGYVSTRGAFYVKPTNSLTGLLEPGPGILPGFQFDVANAVSNIYDIGSSGRRFRDLYLGNSLQTTSVSAANISATGSVNAVSVTATTATVISNVVAGNISTAGTVNAITVTANGFSANTANVYSLNAGNSAFVVSNTAAAISVDTTITRNVTMFTGYLHLIGGTAGQYLQTNGAGNLSWNTISTSSISNGNSNVTVAANGNITLSSNGVANVFVVSNTGVRVAGNLSVSGTTTLGSNSNVQITGGSPGQVLSTNGSGVLSWITTTGAAFFQGNVNSNVSVASSSQINSILPSGAVAKTGDIFIDTNGANYNTQPVYINVNGVWRQFLTAFGGL